MPTRRSLARRVILAAALHLLVCPPGQAREPKYPLATYGRLPALEDMALSPDGQRLAAVKTSQDSRIIFVLPLDGSKSTAGVRVGETKLRRVQWQDDNNVLITASTTDRPPWGFSGPIREWYQLVRYELNTNRVHPIDFSVRDIETFNVVVGPTSIREVDGKSTLFAPGFYRGPDRFLPGLFSIPLTGGTRLLVRGFEAGTEWLVDSTGRPAAQLEYKDVKKTWDLKAHHGSSWDTIASGTAAIDTPHLLGFDIKAENVILRFTENGDYVWRPVSLKDGTVGEPLFAGLSLAGLFTDPRDGRVIGGVEARDDRRYVFFDNELQAHWNAILREYPNEVVHLATHSADFSRMVVEVFGAKDGYSYALYDWYAHRAAPLGSIYSGIKDTAGEVRPIRYPAADGLSISGFLTTPRGVAAKNLPLIVLPHGGPAAHDTERFDWWAQALADQGYAVLQPNYRGSNVDNQLMEAGYGEWGRKMQTDLSDGVHYLAGEGIIDPTRVCIVGASYGGYAALAGVTLQKDIYRCSVSVAGLSDLIRMRDWVKMNHLRVVDRYWERFWGAKDDDESTLREISPIDHLETLNVPILLIHGRDDTVVPFEQSEVMLNALKKAGKPIEMVTLKHEDHWLSSSQTRLQMLEATVAFLRAHNPPD